jgi:dTDP-4-amino-4,6-dideoxygalactose transaminase
MMEAALPVSLPSCTSGLHLALLALGIGPGDIMFFNEEIGWKYKMSSMQAALGLAQLQRLSELVEKRETHLLLVS